MLSEALHEYEVRKDSAEIHRFDAQRFLEGKSIFRMAGQADLAAMAQHHYAHYWMFAKSRDLVQRGIGFLLIGACIFVGFQSGFGGQRPPDGDAIEQKGLLESDVEGIADAAFDANTTRIRSRHWFFFTSA